MIEPAVVEASSLTAPNLKVPFASPLSLVKVTACVSFRSMSLKSITPVSTSIGLDWSSVISPTAFVVEVMVGASFVPVTVTETTCSTVLPC